MIVVHNTGVLARISDASLMSPFLPIFMGDLQRIFGMYVVVRGIHESFCVLICVTKVLVLPPTTL